MLKEYLYKVVPPAGYNLLISPLTIDISPLNHIYWSYLQELSVHERGHHLVP